MIISRTPFRISFFGEGNEGKALATTIDKYCYVTVRYLPPFFDHKFRVAYSYIEKTNDIEEIKHPSVKECLKYMQISKGVEIHHDGDLPARTGLGSNSSFTVGLLNSLYALKGQFVARKQLAIDSIRIEQEYIKENVDYQDQILAAFGGFNLIEFKAGEDFTIHPMTIKSEWLKNLHNHFLLMFTGLPKIDPRNPDQLAHARAEKKKELSSTNQMVDEAVKIINNGANIAEFGQLLNEDWKLKRSIHNNCSTPLHDEIYSTAIKEGALGGKILGARWGGFILIFADPARHKKIKEKLENFLPVPFQFENSGSQIVFYSRDECE